MSPQSWLIFEKYVVFRHLHPLKMVWDAGQRAKKMRFEFLRQPSVFLIQSATTFSLCQGVKKLQRLQKSRFYIFQKKAIEGPITSNMLFKNFFSG